MTPEERRETFQRFVEAVEDGESVRDACKLTGSHWRTLSNWMAYTTNVTEGGEPFHARYARARLVSASSFADRALNVAMDATPEEAHVARLQVDTLKWRAAMANPKEYGDRKQVDTNVTVRMLPVEERDRALQRIVARATLANPLAPPDLGHDAPTPHSDDAP